MDFFKITGQRHRPLLENIGEELKFIWCKTNVFSELLPLTAVIVKTNEIEKKKHKKEEEKNKTTLTFSPQLNLQGGLGAKRRRRETELCDSLVCKKKEIRKHGRFKQLVWMGCGSRDSAHDLISCLLLLQSHDKTGSERRSSCRQAGGLWAVIAPQSAASRLTAKTLPSVFSSRSGDVLDHSLTHPATKKPISSQFYKPAFILQNLIQV